MEDELSRVVDALPGLVWTVLADLQADFLSQGWLAYTGLRSDEIKSGGWPAVIHPEDLPPFLDCLGAMVASAGPGEVEARMLRSDGAYRWFEFRAGPVRDDSGQIVKWCGISNDIEGRKRAEGGQRPRGLDFQSVVDSVPVPVAVTTPSGEVEGLNQATLDYFGKSLDELKGWKASEVVHPDDLEETIAKQTEAHQAGSPYAVESRHLRADGVYRWFSVHGLPMRDAGGQILRWFHLLVDIDDRKRAEGALAASERNLKLIIDTMPALAWSARPDGSADFFNQHYVDYVGLSLPELQDWGWAATVHPDDLEDLARTWKTAVATGSSAEVEARLRRHDGAYRSFLFRANPLRDEKGNIVKWYGVNTDIEERRQAETELRRAYASFADAQRLSKTGSFITNLRADEHNWSDESLRIFELDRGTKITVQVVRDLVHPEDLPLFDAEIGRGQSGSGVDFVFRIITPRGAVKHVHAFAHVIEEVAGRPLFVGALQDVTASKVTEAALRRSEAFLAEAQRLSRTGSFTWHLSKEEIAWSEEAYRIYEIDPATPDTFHLFRSRVHPEDLPALQEVAARSRREMRDLDHETRLLMPDGRIKYVRVVAHIRKNQDGELEVTGAIQDLTERRLAEDTLGELRSELAHVSRISSLGALTASIAHEVRQPLSGIMTNASTCLRMLATDPPNINGARETARRTIRDANRASEVMTRLRALFARKGTTTETVDLNEATREVIAISSADLQRNRVILQTDYDDDLPLIVGDRVQLQQVILNLVRNASDAMAGIDDRPRKLVIRTERDDGDYARLTVQDSGVGFDPQSRERLFDAFYTTKSNGMGIGLSVSRSIIENHHGNLWATSNSGPGVTFAFSIPRRTEDATGLQPPGADETARNDPMGKP